jgi:hypothetical protein
MAVTQAEWRAYLDAFFELRFDPMRICLGSEATKDNQIFTAPFQEWRALNQLVFMPA